MNAVINRIQQELIEIKKNPPTNCSASPINDDDLFHWQGTIIGPTGTPYEGGIFFLNILFSNEYPFKPPKINFITKIFHCNISRTGNICLDLLKDEWSPALNITQILLSITSIPDDQTQMIH